ncbi:hypothetical protein A3L09_02050 [Thermococcus profundus]|uniref:DUF835 domain-containing protein n=1 Tax=Thermococcus profundus TaxID=49899 RepID=A0A2Z2MC41_THEPR|nr:DUF835 domain-containing protein [Thermococcus profundus]ASJ02135.1 hypothetical protein A3L09_02050 [Thermococcus profundus]
MDPTILLIGQSLNVGAKLFASLYLFHSYRHSLRKSALIFAFVLLTSSLSVLGEITGVKEVPAIMEALSASLLFYGSLTLIEEEFSLTVGRGYYVSITPLFLTVYMLAVTRSGNFSWFAALSVAYASSGLFFLLSGVLIADLGGIYGRWTRYLGSMLILYGLHKMDYPFLRPVEWFAPIGFSIAAFLVVLIAYFFVKFASHEEFMKPHSEDLNTEGKLKAGLTLVTSEEYEKLLQTYHDHPVLVFTRKPREMPEKWTVYPLSQVNQGYTINPTNLPKITEIVNKHLRTAGNEGIVIVDGVEYLSMYNGFNAIAKFLSTLRDIAYANRGRVIVVTDSKVWDEKEWHILQRITG